MSDTTQELRRIDWSECGGCTHLFRAFRMATHPTKLVLAFCCVLGTYFTGRVLDAVWPTSSMPVVLVTGDRAISELDKFASRDDGGAVATKGWLDKNSSTDNARRVAPFKLLLNHARSTIDMGASAILNADLGKFRESLRLAANGKLWLMLMHPVYAAIFFLVVLAIWSLFGGALCRAAALHATRDERISLREALAFAQERFLSFYAAPLMPAGIVAFFALLLFFFGLLGAIPAIGEIVVGVMFCIALILGIIIAFVAIGAVGGFALMFPTIAMEGSDAFDALSRSYSYIYQRPWRSIFYAGVSTIYGGLCLLFVKLFVRIALWAIHTFTGASMNWGSAFVHGDKVEAGKLNAIWQGPLLLGDSTFWGSFEVHNLAHTSWFAQLWFYLWIFTVVGFVAAFIVSFFFSASTLIYLLLRREVDATDLEEVYTPEAPVGPAVAPPPPVNPPVAEEKPGEPGAPGPAAQPS